MSKVSLRRLLSKLAALALSTSVAGPAAADPLRDPGPPGATDIGDGDDSDLDPTLPIDRGPLGRMEAAATLGRGLALALRDLRPLSATHLAASWALSEDPLRRHAVGQALEWVFPLVGDSLVIDQLSRDGDPGIRAAAARAAWARRATGGDPGVLARLAADPDPRVREVAASAQRG